MGIIEQLKTNAKKLKKTIILPESEDERTLKATEQIINEGLANIILIGNPAKIQQNASTLQLNIDQATIIDPSNHPNKDAYTKTLFELRKHKGITEEKAAQLVENPLFLACLMIRNNDADGEVAGALNSTGDVIRPALQILKTKPGINVVSSCFLMILPEKKYGENGVLFFADCGLNISPNARELGEIAVTTAQSAQSIANLTPKVAMLSFSTKGSAKHEMADKVIEATREAQKLNPDILIDGELQADAALVEIIGNKKAPDSKIAGNANILVFPDLNAGNIGYKLVQRLANATAIGPILQGIAKPVNDLSRGCSVEDIVTSVAITANQAAE
ncbi:MAG: phosphate acetyltransferase [Bacteroidota bacterium]